MWCTPPLSAKYVRTRDPAFLERARGNIKSWLTNFPTEKVLAP